MHPFIYSTNIYREPTLCWDAILGRISDQKRQRLKFLYNLYLHYKEGMERAWIIHVKQLT